MRTREEINRKIAEREEQMGFSDELDEKMRIYVNALEWVLDGEMEERARLKMSEYGVHFDEVVFGGRTGERKIYPQEITDEDGVYILMRVDEDVLMNGY